MTTTPPEAPVGPPPTEGPRATREELKELGRVRRTVGSDRKVAGVAGGLGRHLDIDPVILRVAFVVLVFFGGAGLIAYAACWLLVPADGSAKTPLGLDDRNRGIALIGAGILASVVLLSDSFGNDFFPWQVAVVGVLVFLVLGLVDRDRPRPTAPPVPHVPDPATGAFAPAVPGTPVVTPPAYRPPPRNPRRRGPILFLFTVALAAIGVAVLGILDLAGAPVADPAYPAVIVGTCGVMLLVGAFYGRAGGIILIGLLASLALFAATTVQEVDGGDIRRTPMTAADVPLHLETGAGEILLDLRMIRDPDALDGLSLDLQSDFGRVEVILPAGVGASVDAEVHGAGHLELFGSDRGGFGIDDQVSHFGGLDAPRVTIDADVTFGEIQVLTEEAAA
jgi:phage shock protein PspC (stress-responsive transcriptional regulator)